MPEGAEDQRLVLGHPVLVLEDADEGLHLGIEGIEIFGPLQERLDIGPDLSKEGGIDGGLAVGPIHRFEAVESSGEHVAQQGGQAVEAARRLATDRGHHELDVLLAVGTRKDPAHDFEQAVMQPALVGCELDRQRFRPAGRKFPDIPATRSVDHRAEGIELLQRADDADAADVVDTLLGQAIVDVLERGRFSKKQAAPLGLCGTVQGCAGFDRPLIVSRAAMTHGRVDEPVGRSHLLEARTVDDEIWPQNVQQGEEILASELHRSGGEKDRGLGVVAEIAYRLVEIGVRVADVVRLVDDHEIEPGRWIEGEQPFVGPRPFSLLAKEQVRIDQGERDDGPGIAVGPFAFQIRFPQTVTQRSTVERLEMLVETLHLHEPLALGHQRLGTDDQHRGNVRPGP